RRKLRAGVDAELPVRTGQVHLDRLRSDEERLGDLAVGGAFGSHLCDAPLAWRERLDACQSDPARAGARGQQLVLAARDARGRAAGGGQLDRPAEVLPGFGATVCAAERCTELGPRLGVLELRG